MHQHGAIRTGNPGGDGFAGLFDPQLRDMVPNRPVTEGVLKGRELKPHSSVCTRTSLEFARTPGLET